MQVITELEQNDKVCHFLNEFQRLMDSLKESHVREVELFDKNRQIKANIDVITNKYTLAVKAIYNNRETIDKLQKVN